LAVPKVGWALGSLSWEAVSPGHGVELGGLWGPFRLRLFHETQMEKQGSSRLSTFKCVLLAVHRQAVDAPSLQAFKARLDVALGSLVCWLATLCIAGGWNSMVIVVLFNPGRSMNL